MPADPSFIRFLSRVPLFRMVDAHHLAQMADAMDERRYNPGNSVLQQGEIGTGLFILIEGRCKVVRTSDDGTRFEVDVLEPFDFFGELSLLDTAPISASVIADAPTICLVLPKDPFLVKLHASPEMALGMLHELASRHRRIVTKL